MKRLLLWVALLTPASAWAQLVHCTQYRVETADPWVTTEVAACAAKAARCDSTNTGCGGVFNSTSVITETSVPSALQCRIRFQNPPDTTVFTYLGAIMQRTGNYCEPPPPEECEADVGHGYWTVSTSPISGASWCEGQCEMTAGASQCGGPPGLQTCTTWTEVTEATCSGGGTGSSGDDPADDPPAGATPDTDGPSEDGGGESCQSIGDGQYCASPSGDGQCGYMNDTYVCLEKIVEDECVALGDGGRVCGGQAATTPPVPDNGTPGVLAEPDGNLSNTPVNPTTGTAGTTNIYNYYSGGTVGASSRDPGTTGAAPTGGSPNYNSQSNGDGGEDGEGDCVGPTCGEGVPALEEVGTMSGAFTAFWSDLQEVPIVEAGAAVAPSFGTGSCPSWSDSVNVHGQSIDVNFNSICTVYEDVSPALTVVALVLWGFLAFRILWSA